jgi:ABC-2 type transport system permease protein
MPEFMQKLGFLSLNGVALKAYLKVLTGYHTNDILYYIIILAAAGLVFSILAVVVLNGREGKADVKRNKTKTAQA